MKKHQIPLIAITALTLLFGAGCSPSSDAVKETEAPQSAAAGSAGQAGISAQNVLVVESGYTSLEAEQGFGDGGYYQYSVTLQNPNKSYDMRDAVLEIEGFDEEGGSIFINTETIPLIPADASIAFAGKAGGGKHAGKIVFSIANGKPEETLGSGSDMFVVKSASESLGVRGLMKYSGEIQVAKAAPEGFDKVRICVTLHETRGRSVNVITAGYSTTVDAAAVGQTIPFSIDAAGVPQHTTYAVTAIPWK